MGTLEVFADIACPFAHAGFARFHAARDQAGRGTPLLRVRAWPLELVNEQPHSGRSLEPKVRALRAGVAPDRFAGFRPEAFPSSSLLALESEAAAHRLGPEVGEAFSLAVREALFDEGRDIADPGVLDDLRRRLDVPAPNERDTDAVRQDLAEGRQRGVQGSPYFFTAAGGFFCPSFDIEHDGDEYEVHFDMQGFERFLRSALQSDTSGGS